MTISTTFLEAPDVRFDRLPSCLSATTLFCEVALPPPSHDAAPTRASAKKAPGEGSGFKFAKAVSGASGAAAESSVTSRGDGKFQDGSCIKQEGNYVMLGPDALSTENAESTLQALDRMQAGGGKKAAPAAAQAAAASYQPDLAAMSRMMAGGPQQQQPLARPRATAFQSVHEAAQGVLFDLDDGDARCRDSSAPSAAPSSTASSSGLLPAPSHTLSDLPADAAGPSRLELRVQLPDISSVAEANVDVGTREVKIQVPGRCRLVVALPCAVDNAQAVAKWSKASRELMLRLRKKG